MKPERIDSLQMLWLDFKPNHRVSFCTAEHGRGVRVELLSMLPSRNFPESAKPESMKEVAENWRKMSFTALKGLMQIQPLDNFPKHTVFIYKDPRKRLLRKGVTEESLVVDFETMVRDEYLTRSLAILKRLEEQVFRQNIGILLWRGPKTSPKDGRVYNDVVIMDIDSADSFANLTPA